MSSSLKDNRPSRGTVGEFLRSGRDGLLPKASETPSSAADMELVTRLVVMETQAS